MGKVSPEPTSGCWLWTAYVDYKGYGRFQIGDSWKKAHRVSYEIHKGDTSGLHVLHKCDNRCCVNPSHLYLGTDRDNVKDRHERNRHWSHGGEQHHAAILTREQVADIRTKRLKGVEFAALYGVKPVTVSAIQKGRIWRS